MPNNCCQTVLKALKYVQHPTPFSRATSPSLIVCLYLAYSKLLKLMAASSAGVYENLTIFDKYLVDHCWMPMPDHHLDHRLSLSHVSHRWRGPRVGAINYVRSRMARPRINGQLYMMQVTKATSKTNCPRKRFCPPPYLETLKRYCHKSGESQVWDRGLSSCKFSLQSAWDVCPRAKIHIYSVVPLESSNHRCAQKWLTR